MCGFTTFGFLFICLSNILIFEFSLMVVHLCLIVCVMAVADQSLPTSVSVNWTTVVDLLRGIEHVVKP